MAGEDDKAHSTDQRTEGRGDGVAGGGREVGGEGRVGGWNSTMGPRESELVQELWKVLHAHPDAPVFRPPVLPPSRPHSLTRSLTHSLPDSLTQTCSAECWLAVKDRWAVVDELG